MDRNWMSGDRTKANYQNGMEEFIAFAVKHAKNPDKILCPCIECCFKARVNVEELRDHLTINGIDQGYTNWVRNVEKEDVSTGNWGSGKWDSGMGCEEEANMDSRDDYFEEMTKFVQEHLRDCPEMFENLSNDAKQPLYSGCTKYSKLSVVLKLYNLKAGNGWSDKSFSALLDILKDMLPEDNVLPARTYKAKKMLSSMGLSYERIHACPNDCILYRKEYESLDSYPICNASRYKRERVPAQVMWYFPIVPRFRRLFSNPDDAKNLTWHDSEKINDGKMRHPADSPQWIKINREFPEFGREARNLRLFLCTDGMNPHSGLSSTHSTWPVVVGIYNLPPWLCMKRKYLMLSMLISGPKQPGHDIDVYLAPLIEDLKMLWDNGVEVFDASRGESFNLKAMLYGTINDFPAYGNLSGYSVKGFNACPVCAEHTSSRYVHNGRKTVYLGHRKFLPINHPYRKLKKAFNGEVEIGRSTEALNGKQVLDKVNGLNVQHGKGNAAHVPKTGFKKKSIFFDLPYWETLYVRHFLDVMHIEKNICDSLIGTLLNVHGKTKDGLNARKDLAEMGIRPELAPVKKNLRNYLPPACHTLSRREKIAFCDFLRGVNVPCGYSSNIRNYVSMKDLKLVGLKSHDCHILMERILPVALRSILPVRVRHALTKLCHFFTEICRKVIDPSKLRVLQNEVVITLCQLEMYFPPSFFDIMVHLVVHLVRETQLCGPAYLRWMYPIERYMKVLKGYVANRSRPEGCIVERYIVEEAIEFCSVYLSNMEPIGLPKSKPIDNTEGHGIMGEKVESISCDTWRQAHLYVLHNSEEVAPYVEKHMNDLRSLNPNKNESWLANEHNRSFIDWLRGHIFEETERSPNSICDRLKWLARGPRFEVLSYSGYQINGYTFNTKERDGQTTTQHSGVTLVAQAMHISSSKDKNPIYASMSYYGFIERIWELDYSKFRVPVFGCAWVENNNGVRVGDLGFTLVDLSRMGYKNEPFIMATQAKQVFYVGDPAHNTWSIFLSANKRSSVEDCDEDDLWDDIVEPISSTSGSFAHDANQDDLYVRDDHSEGMWTRPPKRRRYGQSFRKQTSYRPTKKQKR